MKRILAILLALAVMLCGCTTTQDAQSAATGENVMPDEGSDTMMPDEEGPMMTDDTPKQEIMIQNFAFSPQTITVKRGTTLRWRNEDSVQHTVTSDSGVFDSGLFSHDESYSYTFEEKGEYPYHCTLHPRMTGTVIVE